MLKISAKIVPVPPLASRERRSVSPDFFGVKLTPAPVPSLPEPQNIPQPRTFNRNLSMHNHITVKVSLFHTGATAGGISGAKSLYLPNLANQVLDWALRRELDREISVMSRGEDIMANRRRRNMLERYLASQPGKVVKNFYGVRMLALAMEQKSKPEAGQFYSDILNERTEKSEKTIVEKHTETVVRSGTVQVRGNADLDRLATQVAQRVEQKMKLNRERSGKFLSGGLL